MANFIEITAKKISMILNTSEIHSVVELSDGKAVITVKQFNGFLDIPADTNYQDLVVLLAAKVV